MRRWWLWGALGAALLLIGSGQTWVRGTWQDPVIGTSLIEATGTQTGATLTAGALLAGAAVLAGLVGSRPVRLVAAVCLAGAAVLAGLPALTALLAPERVVEAVVADLPGATGLTIRASDAAATLWPWLGLLGALLLLVAAVLCALQWRRLPHPGGTGGPAGRQPAAPRPRPADAWEDLSRGRDPTLDD